MRSSQSLEQMADEYMAMRKSFSTTNEQSQNSNDIAIVHARAHNFAHKSVSFENGNKTPPLSRRVGNQNDSSKSKLVKCYWCKKLGHKMSECYKRQRQELNNSKVNLKDTEAKSNCLLADNSKQEQRILHDLPIHPLFKPFCTTADIVNSDGNCVQIQMLRDTGALQSVLRVSL